MIEKRFRCQHRYAQGKGELRLCCAKGELCKVRAPGGIAWAKLLCAACQVRVAEMGWEVECLVDMTPLERRA